LNAVVSPIVGVPVEATLLGLYDLDDEETEPGAIIRRSS
jgi:hypothetical protein